MDIRVNVKDEKEKQIIRELCTISCEEMYWRAKCQDSLKK